MHDFLNQVLTIINYEGDRDQYAREFLGIVQDRTAEKMLMEFPQEKKPELDQALARKDSAAIKGLVSAQYSIDQYKKALEDMFSVMINDYLKEVIPTLSDEQKKQLETFLKTSIQSS